MSQTKKAPARSARRRSRELVVQGIYQWRMTGADLALVEKQMREEKNLGNYDAKFFSELLRGVLTQHADLETALAPHLDRPLADRGRPDPPAACRFLVAQGIEADLVLSSPPKRPRGVPCHPPLGGPPTPGRVGARPPPRPPTPPGGGKPPRKAGAGPRPPVHPHACGENGSKSGTRTWASGPSPRVWGKRRNLAGNE